MPGEWERPDATSTMASSIATTAFPSTMPIDEGVPSTAVRSVSKPPVNRAIAEVWASKTKVVSPPTATKPSAPVITGSRSLTSSIAPNSSAVSCQTTSGDVRWTTTPPSTAVTCTSGGTATVCLI